MFITLDKDREYLENKYHRTDEEFDAFRRMEYHGYEYDETTGLCEEEIHAGLKKLTEEMKGMPHATIKAAAASYVIDNTRIDINEHDYFPGIYSLGRLIDNYTVKPWRDEAMKIGETAARNAGTIDLLTEGASWDSGLVWTGLDFDHTVPDWDSLMELGIGGIRKRIIDIASKKGNEGTLSEKQNIFAKAVEAEYLAFERLISRLCDYAYTKDFEKSQLIKQSLENLRDGAPQNIYDALMLMYMYFIVSECIDHYQVRSLGYGLDATLYPFYKKDVENGTFTKEQIKEFIAYFLMQFSAIGNYWGQPFYLAGTNLDGSTKVNELTHLILDTYDELGIYNPKIQIKVNLNTPKDFVYKVLEMIRSGMTSIVLINEDLIVKSLMNRGATYEEAVDGVISGCYEYKTKASGVALSSVYFNVLKMVSLVFTNGVDVTTGKKIGAVTGEVSEFKTFKDFFEAFKKQFEYIVNTIFTGLCYYEEHSHEVNPSLIFSATIPKCANNLTDAHDKGLDNGSETLLNGFASAVDALMAVYELVFETKVTNLNELKDAIANNWEGYEKLRIKAQKCKHKFGRGDRMADYYANAIHQFYVMLISGRRNSKGGKYGYELHSARSFIEQGWNTEATPDGRKAGEETSKNISPSVGADTNGITALIKSVTTLDLSLASTGACLDAMLHPSAVQGDDGLDVLYGILSTYLAKGGASIHFNIFNTDTLRDAQKNPEKYRNLQVRVCGWNVLWNNLCKEEQEAYIKRAESII